MNVGIGPAEMIIMSIIAVISFGPPILMIVAVVYFFRNKKRGEASLVPCPECGRKISQLATTCPQCGYPLAQLQK